MLALARFALRDKSVMLLTQGLGPQPCSRQQSPSSERMDQQRSRDARELRLREPLATIIGTKTAGNVLGAGEPESRRWVWFTRASLRLVHGQRQVLEGQGVSPDLEVDADQPHMGRQSINKRARAAEFLDAA